jgi:hypothetical protein
MRRAMAILAALLCALTTACGGQKSEPGDVMEPEVIEVTIKGDQVTPSGERVEVAVGQPIELRITADEPGEIHIHSTPEQQLEYDAGETTETIDGIDAPGTVDVESHSLDKVIVQLEVS